MKLLTLSAFAAACLLLHSPRVQAQDQDYPNAGYTPDYLADELNAHMYDAMVDYMNGENTMAANEVRKSVRFVRSAERSAKGVHRAELKGSQDELTALQSDLLSNKEVSARRMRHVFSKADLAIARHHLGYAVEFEAKKDFESAGSAMASAAQYTAHAGQWAGEEVGEGSEDAWRGVKKVGHDIGVGATVTAEDVSKGIKAVDNETKKLGKKMFSRKKEKYDIFWIEADQF